MTLQVDSVSVNFGGIWAVRDVSFTVPDGHVFGLVGANGSGKTTLLNVISGFQRVTSGSVTWNGVDITSLDVHKRANRGISRVFQAPVLMGDRSVLDNVKMSTFATAGWGTRSATARELLAEFELTAESLRPAHTLPFGHVRKLEICRALALKPSVLLLDEPAVGMSSHERELLADVVRGLPQRGVSVVVVEHDTEFVSRVCDTVHVLHAGQTLANGAPEEVLKDRRVIETFLGGVVTDDQ